MSGFQGFTADILYAIREGFDSYVKARRSREYMRIRNMTPDEYNKMLERQGRIKK